MPQEHTLRERFYKEFTRSHPGDSGFNGTDPQEPVWEMVDDPKEIADWWLNERNVELQALKEKIQGMYGYGDYGQLMNKGEGGMVSRGEILSLLEEEK